MFELYGKFTNAKIFATTVEAEAIAQIQNMINQPVAEDSQIRIMADTHAGAGCTIGTTMTIDDRVCPNLVGVDIGCGMLTVQLKEKADEIDFAALDNAIRRLVPSGKSVHTEIRPGATRFCAKNLKCFGRPGAGISEDKAFQSVGTLGGGNHFIEVDKDEDDNAYLVIHTGSRHLGKEVATYYQNLAVSRVFEPNKNPIFLARKQAMIDKYKASGRQKEIQSTIKALYQDFAKNHPKVQKSLAFLIRDDMWDYIHDVKVVQEFAQDNRAEIARLILMGANLTEVSRFETVHNYIDTEHRILRKGAVSAQKDEILLIPINMRDGSLICRGKGNPDYNFSAPHGAGRLMSRSKAKENLSMDDFKDSMKGIYTTSVSQSTIDESPMAYKPVDEILENIKDTVDILKVIKPVYNFKASDEDA